MQKARVLLVPFPITPAIAYSYFLLRRSGLLHKDVAVRYYTGESSDLYFADKAVVNLSVSSHVLSQYLENLRAYDPEFLGKDLRRLYTFCCDGDGRTGYEIFTWLCRLSLTNSPKRVLEEAAEYFEVCIRARIDLWSATHSLPTYQESVSQIPHPADKRRVTLPVFKGTRALKDEIVGFTTRELHEGRIWELQPSQLVMVVGGPSGSGKSTITASLAAEMENIIRSLKTRLGWGSFSLKLKCSTLDLATPTLEAILVGSGKDRSRMDELKRPWTKELAEEGLEKLISETNTANLVLADLPGKIDGITELLSAYVDVGIIITKDWEQILEWRQFFKKMGIYPVAEIKSGERSSIVTTYLRGRFIAGRVEPLARMARSWDRVISWLAEFLLFEILPTFVTRRREKLEYVLKRIELKRETKSKTNVKEAAR